MASTDGVSDEELGEAIDILLVEPNPGDTRLFEENFREAKLMNAVHAVSSGEEAIDFLRQRDEYADAPRPDLVLLEPQLPSTSGAEILAELDDEEALREIPVIVLTSSEVGEDIVRSNGIEADEYIRKPVETEEFIEFVQEVESFWFAIVRNDREN